MVDPAEGSSIATTSKHQSTERPILVGEACLEEIQDLGRAKELISTDLGLSGDAVFECRVALAEAVSNALIHGRRDGVSYCRVRVLRQNGAVHIAVEDRGEGFRWRGLQAHMPPPEQQHGRGVHLIRSLMDAVAIHSTKDGTRVEMTRFLEPRGK